MAEDSENERHSRIVTYTRDADRDLSEIYSYTAKQWGIAQADDYLEFLDSSAHDLAERPTSAPWVPGLNYVRSWIAKWENARHGHRIFFEETDQGIIVLRILHTAMNWPDHLQGWSG